MLSNAMAISSVNLSIVDISQVNIKELIRNVGEEEAIRLLKMIMKNNTKILEFQKTLMIIIKINEKERRREQEREWRRREYEKRWEEEEQRKIKEREKEEERKIVDDE